MLRTKLTSCDIVHFSNELYMHVYTFDPFRKKFQLYKNTALSIQESMINKTYTKPFVSIETFQRILSKY